jgi:uncharacterized protein with von Willebrand factor type A (vWA) domain
MKAPLLGFLRVARNAGISVSVAESIEAFEATDLVGYEDRQVFKDALQLVLAKNDDERERFEQCFERYFGLANLELPPDERIPLDADVDSELARILLDDDRAALVRALFAAAAEANVADVRLFTQINRYVRRILELMGVSALEEAIARLRGSGDAEDARIADFLDERRRAVGELARDIVERRLAPTAGGAPEAVRDEFLRDARLINVDRRDVERMRTIVRAMARRLASRYGRMHRRARRGHLDVRKTMRRNISSDGVPFRTAWKRRRIEKPRIVLLCDVSGSVAALAHFLLLFVYALTEEVADVRSFAFANTLFETSEIFETKSFEDAIAEVMNKLGYRSSDYGRSLEEFRSRHMSAVDRRTTVVILGDGRSNYGEPRVDVMRELYERAKRVVWLNPEPRVSWGLDDSVMLRYQQYCHIATVCNRLRHLEDAVENLLKSGRR